MEVRAEIDKYKRMDGTHRIFLVYTHRGDPTTISMPRKPTIELREWDRKKHRPKKSGPLRDYIDDEKRRIKDIAYRLIDKRMDPAGVLVKDIYMEDRKPTLKWWEHWEMYLKEVDYKLKDRTRANYRHLEATLRQYEQDKKDWLIFEKMTVQFYNRFRMYMAPRWSENTFGVYMNFLRAFLNYALDSEWTESTGYKRWPKSIRKRTNDGHAISARLTLEELKTLRDFETWGRLAITRDRFLLHCYTGLRYNDAQSGNYEIIKGEFPVLKYRNNKGSNIRLEKIVRVPLIPQAAEILEHYGGFPQITLSIFNHAIKDLFSQAGIKKEVAISSHMARKTFSSLLAENGVSDQLRRAALGHANDRLNEVYVKMEIRPLYDIICALFATV